MPEIIRATILLYQHALGKALRSFVQSWMISVAVVIFAGCMLVAGLIAGPLGLLGGFLLGAVNALLVGATLGLIEDAIRAPRRLKLQDIWSSFGQYFWDVIGVLFVLWVPMMLLERGMAANPKGPLIASAVFFLLFVILNPAPEVIYQVRHDTPLDVIRESYEFVVENWFEWFLPIAVLLAPVGLSFVIGPSSRLDWAGGLSFVELLFVPGRVLASWMDSLGVPSQLSWFFVLFLTPPLAVLLLLFRGHLFAALHGTSRRQRMFALRALDKE